MKKRCIRRDKEAAHNRHNKDYFLEDSVYNEHQFCRRFRKRGLTSLSKCTATMRILTYGIAVNCVDEYLKIGANTALQCMKNFALGVIKVFGN